MRKRLVVIVLNVMILVIIVILVTIEIEVMITPNPKPIAMIRIVIPICRAPLSLLSTLAVCPQNLRRVVPNPQHLQVFHVFRV